MSVTSSVCLHGGIPTLFVNGNPIPALAYITYLFERAAYGDFAAAGYQLYSFSCFFGTQGINEMSGIYPFADGLFEDPIAPDFAPFDDEMARILTASPEAMVFPRVNVSLPARWEREHPEECNDSGIPLRPPRACFASKLWQEEVKRCLSLLVRHIEAQDYRDHIVGYQLSGGQTEEWFPFDFAGGVGLRSREGFSAAYPAGGDELDFRRYLNDTVADVIASFCTHVKNLTDHRLVVGSFYGYTLETPAWSSGHHSLMRLIACPDVDFLCSPISYARLRAPGHDFAPMLLIDTLKHHGKLYFSECDVRTFLTKPLPWCRPNACPPGTYESEVWMPQGDEWTSRQVLRAVFARQLTHGTALWWFDMFGGWFASEGIMEDMAAFRAIADRALFDSDRRSVAELAVVVDDTAFLQVDGGTACTERDFLGLCGTPYDIFELADIEHVLTHYRAVVFLTPHMSDTMETALYACAERGIPYLVQDGQTVPDPPVLRALCAAGGLHIYCDTTDVVYADRHYLALHATTAGPKTLRLTEPRVISALFGEVPSVLSDTVTFMAREHETFLLRVD